MKIKRYKLKDGVTKEELISLGARDGGTWINKSVTLFFAKSLCFKNFEFSINIGFKDNISDWNDFDNVIILDEDFCQPYVPFYGDNFGKEVKNFPVLEECIRLYNKYMDSLSFLEEVGDDYYET